MNKSENKLAISVFLGAVAIAIALYLGLTKKQLPTSISNTPTPTVQPSPSPILTQNTPSPETNLVQPSPTPEITWTKTELIAALSDKTGIPESEITFSTGDTSLYGDTELIRGTVQRIGEMGGAGFFAVADINGIMVTYTGQGVPECSEVNPYGYPVSWADYCTQEGDMIKR